MLEKLAEMVRAEAISVNCHDQAIPCITCGWFGAEAGGCKGCCLAEVGSPDGSLMLVRWAVLLVARGLKDSIAEAERKEPCNAFECEKLGVALMDLIAEAREAGEWPPRPR